MARRTADPARPAASAGAPALVLTVHSGGQTRHRPLPRRGRITIGRAAECDVCLEDDAEVSRRHAELVVDGARLRLRDLGSANGTRVLPHGGSEATARGSDSRAWTDAGTSLEPGQAFQVGSVVLVVRPAPEVATAPGAGAESGHCIAVDPAMRAVFEWVRRVADAPIPVLILGETGVGKELVAAAIHRASSRGGVGGGAPRPFVTLHCAALAESVLESELFGHEPGAFTGARAAKPGLLESADGGTVFLDEVGELPLSVQVKLLRVLEDLRVMRVGGLTPRKLDVRFVAATNRDLVAEVARGAFRQDLYFRLNGVSLTVPPLRERPADIMPLARSFAAVAFARRGAPATQTFTRAATDVLTRYHWPGNVRELRHLIERAALLSDGAQIDAADLGPLHAAGAATAVHGAPAPAAAASPEAPAASLREDLEAIERARILAALKSCGGNQTRAATLLGMPRRTLIARLEAYGIERPRKRPR